MRQGLCQCIVVLFFIIFIGCESSSSDFTPGDTPSSENDITPPVVVSTLPVNNAEDVPIDTDIRITFSESLDTSGITETVFTISGGQTITLTFTDTEFVFTSTANFDYDTPYSFTIPKDYIKDLVGNEMVQDYTFSFRTQALNDSTPPYVISTTPANGAIGVPVDTNITITFSEPIDTSIITEDTITLPNGYNVNIYYTDTSIILSSNISLDYYKQYTLTVPKYVKDESGNEMTEEYTFSFTTEFFPIKIVDMVCGNDPDVMYAITENGLLYIINIKEIQIEKTIEIPIEITAGQPSDIEFSSVDNKLYIIKQDSNEIEVFDIDSSEFEAVNIIVLRSVFSGIEKFKIDPINRFIYTLSYRLDTISMKYFLTIVDMDNKIGLANEILNASLEEPSEMNTTLSIQVDQDRNVYISYLDNAGSHVSRYRVEEETGDYGLANFSLIENNQADFNSCTGPVSVSTDGSSIVIPCNNIIYDLNNELVDIGKWYIGGLINDIKFTPDGYYLYGVTNDNQLFISHLLDYDDVTLRDFPNTQYFSITTSNNNASIVVGFSYNNILNQDHNLYFFPVADE